HQNHIFAVRCREGLLPEFLGAWLAGPEARLYFHLTAKKTTNLASTNSTTVGELPICVPPLEDQLWLLKTIAEEEASVIAAMEEAQREIALLQEFRTRLVADVVTGQVDVRAIAATLPKEPEAVADFISETDDELAELTDVGDD